MSLNEDDDVSLQQALIGPEDASDCESDAGADASGLIHEMMRSFGRWKWQNHELDAIRKLQCQIEDLVKQRMCERDRAYRLYQLARNTMMMRPQPSNSLHAGTVETRHQTSDEHLAPQDSEALEKAATGLLDDDDFGSEAHADATRIVIQTMTSFKTGIWRAEELEACFKLHSRIQNLIQRRNWEAQRGRNLYRLLKNTMFARPPVR